MEEDGGGGGAGALYLQYCMEGTLTEGARFARDLVAVNVVFRFLLQKLGAGGNGNGNLAHRHLASASLGALLLYWKLGFAFLWTSGLVALSYFLLMVYTLALKRHRGALTSASVVGFLLYLEYGVVPAKTWHAIRGVQMIAAMKAISVGMELQRGRAEEPPSPAAYAGYLLCPASCLLGPWCSLREYERCLEPKYLDRRWARAVFLNAALALFWLSLSNCAVPWYIGDASPWARAYRDAQAFRASHYFVSLMSQSEMIAAGFGDRKDGDGWSVRVAKPLSIEFPRSLARVVSDWNVPMRRFLKTYAFEACGPRGGLRAVLATYAASSLLHGLNFQLSATLLSVGAFSFVEYEFRSKVSRTLDACCGANPCPKSCGHRRGSRSPLAIAFNLAMSLLAAFQLAYLGVAFGASVDGQDTGYSMDHALGEWAELNYAGHWVAAGTYVACLLI